MPTTLKVVIPAAGLGTRLLPATIAQPKEMMIVVDKPAIQYVVEEAIATGLKDILIVTGKNKRAIEDHFDPDPELLRRLKDGGIEKAQIAHSIEKITKSANIMFVRQNTPKGSADAIWQAKTFVGSDSFVVMYGDSFFAPDAGEDFPTKALINTYRKTGKNCILVRQVPEDQLEKYGVVEVKPDDNGELKVVNLIEKPSVKSTRSNLAVAGRYLFTPEIFKYFSKLKPHKGELYINDAIQPLIERGELLAVETKQRRYDIGSKLDFILANIELGMRRGEFREEIKATVDNFKF